MRASFVIYSRPNGFYRNDYFLSVTHPDEPKCRVEGLTYKFNHSIKYLETLKVREKNKKE
jgi:hypothetical protein